MKITPAIVCFLVLTMVSQAQVKPLPQLKVSANHRYFTTQNGDPFFWLGDTGWLLFIKLNREQVVQYLDQRKQQGFNVIQIMVVHDTRKAVNVYGDSALVNQDVARPRTTPGNNPNDTAQYDFWDHVDYVISEAEKRGIYIGLVPVWGTNVKNGWVKQPAAKQYATFLANRFKDRSNIIWLNGGDIHGSTSMDVWNTIGNTIRSIDPKHLITFHPFGRTTSSRWFHNQSWLSFNMFQSGHRSYAQDTSKGETHYAEDNWRYVQEDYAKRPIKPTMDGEPSYEGIPYGLHDTTQPYWNSDEVRRYAYWSVLAGGAGFTYGNNAVMQFYQAGDKGSAYGAKKFWQAAINDPGAQEMHFLKELMLSKPYFERVPDQTLVHNNGQRYDRVVASRGSNYALLYTWNGRPFDVVMGKIKGVKVKANWFNPKDGTTQFISELDNTGIKHFDPPGDKKNGNDWVLILDSE